jgi:cytochrome c biogenesis protein CcdA
LLGVEWSKATDTRSARWLLALVGVITTGMTLGVPILAPTNFEQSHASYLRLAALGLIILLPVVAILMLTGEWSQRSIITTFTQEPRRMRVINAKLVVSMMLGGLGAVFGGVVTAGSSMSLLAWHSEHCCTTRRQRSLSHSPFLRSLRC